MDVKEWLGEDNQLGIDIWNKKYRYGNETFEEWLTRVSGGDEDVKDLIRNKKFLFGGRILSNRGLDKTGKKITLSNCFLPGTQVLTKNGYKNIEDIKKGEYVLSDDGLFHMVNETMTREYSGDIYHFSSLNFKNDIYCTPNHQFLTNHGWKRADRIFAGSEQFAYQDKLKIANIKDNVFSNNGNDKVIKITDGFVPEENARLCYTEDNKVELELFVDDRGTKVWRRFGCNPVNEEIEFDDDFSYFVGRWLGDGSITRRENKRNPSILQIVFNAKTERDSFERCKEIGEKAFGISASCRETEQNVLALRFENEIVGTWFFNHFGEKCDGKFIPDEYLGNFQMALGLCDSDGMLYRSGGFRIVLKNKNMIEWLRETLYLNGINAGKIHSVDRQPDTYEFKITTAHSNHKLNPFLSKIYTDNRHNKEAKGDYEYARVKDVEIVEDYHGFVYNLSVEDTHNYVVEGVVCHNCYVVTSPEDNLESIFECASKLARTYSYGGGCGVDISKLAPRGARVNNAAEASTGAVSFMDLYSLTTGLIGQNKRRGALMLSISCDHPDLEEFIGIKSDLNRVTKANISVRITDKFMAAVMNRQPFNLSFTREETGEVIEKTVDAYKMFKKMCEMNWNYAEPGMLFWDRIENWNLLSCDDEFHYAGTNPCALRWAGLM